MNICIDCNEEIQTPKNSIGTGYALTPEDNLVCYNCCAIRDKKQMIKDGKVILYFTGSEVTNWPGTLKFPVLKVSASYHNIADKRYDYWFRFNGSIWHGYTIGDNTQIAHCKRTKQVA